MNEERSMDAERRFSRIYIRLVSRLEPDPFRSEEALRTIRRAIAESEGASDESGSISETPVVSFKRGYRRGRRRKKWK